MRLGGDQNEPNKPKQPTTNYIRFAAAELKIKNAAELKYAAELATRAMEYRSTAAPEPRVQSPEPSLQGPQPTEPSIQHPTVNQQVQQTTTQLDIWRSGSSEGKVG